MPIPTLRRLALAGSVAATLVVVLACSSQSLRAHEWPSPTPGVAAQQWPNPAPVAGGWHAMAWAGPEAGPPAKPSARNCARAPQPFDFSAGPGWEPAQASSLSRRESGRADVGSARGEALAKSSAAPAIAERSRDSSSEAAAMHAPQAPQAMSAQPPRPAHESVTAGVVDDNADFGEYLAYRERNRHLSLRTRDITERYALTVHDARGRPVPDAEVAVYAGTRALPLWARTDAGGRAWLHPSAAAPWPASASLLEVQVRDPRSGARGAALLQRGQKDQLQVRLDRSVATPRPQLDIAFLIDATGSMGDEIDKLKRSMRAVADQIAHLPSQPDLCFALVSYRDRGDAFFVRGSDFTNDLPAFQRQLEQLRAGGGGDMPEALNEALHTTVHRLSWRGDGTARIVLLVADAPPHLDYGAPYYDNDAIAALAKGIKLFAVGASGLDPLGEAVFRQAAQYTGGRFVFLTYADARNPSSGPGRETLHDVRNYSVETLDKLIVRLVGDEMAAWPRS